MPLLLASRRANNSPYTTTASGIGDTMVTAQTWVFNPKTARSGNVSLGFGVMTPLEKIMCRTMSTASMARVR